MKSRKAGRPRKPPSPAATVPTGRVEVVDAARGVAIVMMIAYHFCFDLTYFHWTDWKMLDDAPWIAWRSAIVTTFLFVVGMSLALREDRERRDGRSGWLDPAFLRRWAQVAGAALLVTVGSAFLFPETFIYFGVLHFVAVAIWLCRRAPRLGGWAIVGGAGALVVGLSIADEAFDPRWINWIGLAANKPLTEDYVPLLPWLGVVLIGCGAGALWARRGFAPSRRVAVAWNAMPAAVRRTLTTLGRWSLTIYLLHQPLLLGLMTAIRPLT